MPNVDGLEATRMIAEQLPGTKVLLFTAYSERSLLGRGFESGAKGYVLKEAPHETLVCMRSRKVAAGEEFVDPARSCPRRSPAATTSTCSPPASGRSCSCSPTACRTPDVAEATALHLAGDGQEPRAPHITSSKLEAETPRTQAVAIALREADDRSSRGLGR